MASATAPTEGLARRRLRAGDSPRAVALSAEAGWNQTEADWRMMLALGDGVGLWTASGALAATALALPYGGAFAWISMVLVTAAFRRRGIAGALLRDRMEWLAGRGLTPLLDATAAGRAVYLGLGFRDLSGFRRLHAGSVSGSGERDPRRGGPAAPRPASEGDLDAIAAFDAAVFGADRAAVLANLFERRPERAFVSVDGGEIRGYVLARSGRDAHHVGPLAANDPETAVELATLALQGLPGPVSIDVPDHQAALTAWLAERGFAVRRPFTRMILGRGEPFGDPARSYAVAGPELG